MNNTAWHIGHTLSTLQRIQKRKRQENCFGDTKEKRERCKYSIIKAILNRVLLDETSVGVPSVVPSISVFFIILCFKALLCEKGNNLAIVAGLCIFTKIAH